jgi:putative membrane protein
LALVVASSFILTTGATVKDDFWTEAAQGGMAEVQLSNLALQKTQSEAVRQFAQQMVTDHTAANNELMQLASSKNVTLPTTMDSKHQSIMTKLQGRSGADFDRDYMKAMVDDHEKAVKLFTEQSQKGTDTDAKAFAAKTLPTLQNHLQMARSLNDSLKGSKSGDSNDNSNSGNMNMNSNNMNMNSNGGNSNRGNSNSNRKGNTNGNTNSNRR